MTCGEDRSDGGAAVTTSRTLGNPESEPPDPQSNTKRKRYRVKPVLSGLPLRGHLDRSRSRSLCKSITEITVRIRILPNSRSPWVALNMQQIGS